MVVIKARGLSARRGDEELWQFELALRKATFYRPTPRYPTATPPFPLHYPTTTPHLPVSRTVESLMPMARILSRAIPMVGSASATVAQKSVQPMPTV